MEEDSSLLWECLERTLAEIEALEAIYGTELDNEELHETDDDNNDNGRSSGFSVLTPREWQTCRSLVEQNFQSPSDDSISSDDIPEELQVELRCPVEDVGRLRLQCVLPRGYPEQTAARVTHLEAWNNSNGSSSNGNFNALFLSELNEMAESLRGSEAVMTLVETSQEWVSNYWHQEKEQKEKEKDAPETPVHESNTDPNTPSGNESLWQLMVLSSHHLLDHAPDNWLAKGGGNKYKLTGWYRFGTPGLAICIGNDNDNPDLLSHQVDAFRAALQQKMPQKKFELVLQRALPSGSSRDVEGWKEATGSEMEAIQQILTPDEFREIFKLQGGTTTTAMARNSTSENPEATGANSKKKKKNNSKR